MNDGTPIGTYDIDSHDWLHGRNHDLVGISGDLEQMLSRHGLAARAKGSEENPFLMGKIDFRNEYANMEHAVYVSGSGFSKWEYMKNGSISTGHLRIEIFGDSLEPLGTQISGIIERNSSPYREQFAELNL